MQNSPAGTLKLITFGANSDIPWNCPSGNSEFSSFWRQLRSSLGLEIPGDSSQVFLFAFPRWGLLCLSFREELHISPLGFYYTSPFLGNYINHQKYEIAYVSLDPVSDCIYIADLNTRLRVGWKTLPNLNFKLKFQTQTWISKLKYSLSSRVIRDSGKMTPRVKVMKETKQWVGI